MTARVLILIFLSALFLAVIPVPMDALPSATVDTPDLLFVKVLFDDIDNGEFFSIYNCARETIDLTNWSISDGEGQVVLLKGCVIKPSSELIIARSYASFVRQNGFAPDFSLLDDSNRSALVRVSGSFRLSNEGDELILRSPDLAVVDCISFGTKANVESVVGSWHGEPIPSAGRGCILIRQSGAGGYLDTDSKDDWIALRVYRPGQSSFEPLECEASVTALLLPEHSNVVLESLMSAEESVRICTYEFDSGTITGALIRLLEKDVDVEMLIEGSPVGGIKDRETELVDRLSQMGARISMMKSPQLGEAIRRYPYLHSKYMIIDNRISIVLSENFVTDVFDVELGRGNRGWGALIESPIVASYLAAIFKSDAYSGLPDVIAWSPKLYVQSDALLYNTDVRVPDRFVPPPPTAKCQLKIMPSPDTSDVTSGIEKILSLAERSISIELFYADLNWKTPMKGTIVNPMLTIILNKMKIMNELIVCLDGSWLSSEDGRNADVISLLSGYRNSSFSSFYVGSQNPGAPFSIIHNKGFVMDHRYSVISSINWAYDSACSNRELSIVIDDINIATFFEDNIRRDVFGDTSAPYLRPNFSFSDDGNGFILSIDPGSDDSGLRSVTFTTDSGRRSNWSIEFCPENHPAYVDIEAVDLWGNRAEFRIAIFPPSGNKYPLMQPDLRMVTFGLAVTGLSYAIVSSMIYWLRWRKMRRPGYRRPWEQLE